MRIGAFGILLGGVLLFFACSDSTRVEPPSAIPPPPVDGPAVVAKDPRPLEPENPAAEARDSRSREPRRLAVEVVPRKDSAPEALDPLALRLDDALARGDDFALEEAMTELEERGGSDAITALGAVLEHHPDADVRLDALDSIAAIIEEGFVPPVVLVALEDRDPDVRMEAIEVIADSEDVTMLSVLERHSAGERAEEVRDAYDEAIEDLRDVHADD